MTRRLVAAGAAAVVVLGSAGMVPAPEAGASDVVSASQLVPPGGQAPSGDQVPTPPADAPGVTLSPEVAEVPASSARLDAAQAELDALERRRRAETDELSDAGRSRVRDEAELRSVRSLSQRRRRQLDKAEPAARRAQQALADVTIDRFVTGDHFLAGLDPALSSDARNELARRQIMSELGTQELLAEVAHRDERVRVLREQRAQLERRAEELDGRIRGLASRISELEASLAALGPRIDAARAERDDARLDATIDGTDMTAIALDAYWRAEQLLRLADPSCEVRWSTLAGIGRTESRHGTYRDAALGRDGVAAPPIFGPELDGSDERFAVVPDSDGGRLDGTARTDRAVGPMQFLPSTWSVVGTDLTGDGTADPQNIFDAAASAGVYLCRSGPGLADVGRLRSAILTYNRSQAYADLVLERADDYASRLPLG